MEAGGIAPLVAVLRDGTDDSKTNAACALFNLATTDNATKGRIVEAGGIAPLIALLRDGTDDSKIYAAHALFNLAATDNATRGRIVEEGGIAPLVALLRDGTDGGRTVVAGALRELAINDAIRGLIADADDWEVRGVQDGSEVVRDLANYILGKST